MNGKKILTLVCTAALLLVSGCSSSTELKNLYIVEGVGIDQSGGDFKLSYQIFNAKSSGGGGQTDKKSGGQSQNLFVTANGSTLYDASRNTSLQVGKKLYFANASVFVLGEDICRTKFSELIDFFERSPEVQQSLRIVVAKGSASQILSAKNEDQIISVDNLKQMVENSAISSKILDVQALNVYQAESTDIKDVALPAIKLSQDGSGNETIVSDGSAVFSANRLAGYLNNAQTRGVMWVEGKAKSGIITVDLPESGKASMQITGAKAKIDAGFNGKEPYITVNVNFSTRMVDYESSGDTTISSKLYGELTELQNEAVRQEVQSALDTSLKIDKADIFGFGVELRRANPAEWKKISDHWNDILPNLNYRVNVQSTAKMITTLAGKQG